MEDVHGTDQFLDPRGNGVYLRAVQQVHDQRMRLGTQFPAQGVQPVGGAVDQHDLGAFRQHRAGAFQPDPGRGAGDRRDLA